MSRMIAFVIGVAALGGCAHTPPAEPASQEPITTLSAASKSPNLSERVARHGLKMLTPESHFFNPEKGRAYLEYGLTHGSLKSLEVPAPVLVELLKDERLARKKNKALEQKLATMKEIDLESEERENQDGTHRN